MIGIYIVFAILAVFGGAMTFIVWLQERSASGPRVDRQVPQDPNGSIHHSTHPAAVGFRTGGNFGFRG